MPISIFVLKPSPKSSEHNLDVCHVRLSIQKRLQQSLNFVQTLSNPTKKEKKQPKDQLVH
jgi:hypothetical protein